MVSKVPCPFNQKGKGLFISYTEKLSPHPQVLEALGLIN